MEEQASSQTDEFRELILSSLHQYKIPGVTVAVIGNDFKPHFYNYGYRDEKSKKEMNEKTIFPVASISKTLAAWGVMKLAEEKKIDLDRDVDSYLNRWKIDNSGDYTEKVTARRLLNHTAGISVRGYFGWKYKKNRKVPSIIDSLNGIKFRNKKVRLELNPGSTYCYSGGAYSILQLLVEEVAKVPFSDYLTNTVLKPLKMNHSYVKWNGQQLDETAFGHNAFKRVKPRVFSEEAACGMYLTMEDLSRFMVENLKVLKDETYQGKVLNQKTLRAMVKKAAININYGLGYAVYNLEDKTKIITHRGQGYGYNARYMILPKQQQAIAIFANGHMGENLISNLVQFWLRSNQIELNETMVKLLGLYQYENSRKKLCQQCRNFLKGLI